MGVLNSRGKKPTLMINYIKILKLKIFKNKNWSGILNKNMDLFFKKVIQLNIKINTKWIIGSLLSTEGYPINGARLSIIYLTHKSNMHNMGYNMGYCEISLRNLKGINLSWTLLMKCFWFLGRKIYKTC